MDSLTQIVLGGAVGEAVLGKKVGNKAVLWGAIGGTIPDLDTIPGQFMDTVSRLEVHRGFSHSIVFALLIAPLLGFVIHKLYQRKNETDWWGWTQLFFWSIFTHPLLDIFTTWGTQFFWPMEWRIAIQSIFVIDPLYTLPFLICFLAVLLMNRKSDKRRKWNRLGLIISSSYLLITLGLKLYANYQFENLLEKNAITYKQYDSRPTPFNSLLWTFNVEREDDFLIAYYSIFDKGETLEYKRFPKNEHLLKPYRNNPKVERLIFLTKGYYTIQQTKEGLYMNDLRFGLIDGFSDNNNDFVFTYIIKPNNTAVQIDQKENSFKGMEGVLIKLWKRMWGIG
ncbi:MAG: metal-dependent hydrolase [Flavobacteriales bacterium]|nr:metal-dependent hydrolase [Flavobacteriales bacterium]